MGRFTSSTMHSATSLKKRIARNVVILLACGIGIGITLRTIDRGNALVEVAIAEPSAGTYEEQFSTALKHSDEEQQRWAARAIFANLGLDELSTLAELVEKFTGEFSENGGGQGGWILCDEFYGRWGELAPLEALKSLKNHESYWAGLDGAVWTGWARTDPDAAVAAYDPKLESQYSRELQDAILDGLCAVDPTKALRFADAQEIGSDYNFTPENRDEIRARYSASLDLLEYVPVERPYDTFGLALYSWIHRDPEGALKGMLTLRYDYLQQASLNALFSNWMIRDPDAAQLALAKITDRGLRESTTHTAMQAYLLRHPREAFERIIELPKYVAYVYSDGSSINADPFAESDPSEEAEIIEVDEEDSNYPLPDRFCYTDRGGSHDRLELISEAAASLAILEGKAAWDRAAAIKNKNKRSAALGGALAGWLIFDLEEAASFAAAGIANHSFEDPGGPDFPNFAARLVSKNLAQRDFKQAIAWVEALPAGRLREAGIKTAADTRLDQALQIARKEASPDGWVNEKVFQKAQKREYAPVMEWLASLPPSKGRDDATYWLVHKLEDHDDPS